MRFVELINEREFGGGTDKMLVNIDHIVWIEESQPITFANDEKRTRVFTTTGHSFYIGKPPAKVQEYLEQFRK